MKKQLSVIATLFILNLAIPMRLIASTYPINAHIGLINSDRSSTVITVEVENTASIDLIIPKPASPTFSPHGRLMSNIFEIIDEKGNKAKYIGDYYRFSFSDKIGFYETIKPKQIFRSEIDLSKDYELKPGKYVISYRQKYGDTSFYKKDYYLENEIESNKLEIYLPDDYKTSKVKLEDEFERPCTSIEQRTIFDAKSLASEWSRKSFYMTLELPEVEEKNDEGQRYLFRAKIKSDPNYTFWFNEPKNDSKFKKDYPDLFDQANYNPIDYAPLKVAAAILIRSSVVEHSCGCSPKFDRKVRALARTDSPYLVSLCDSFFELPPAASDGQASTILHELIHFGDEHAEQIGDRAYGRKDAHKLATTDREQAISNADNHLYFIESINGVP